MEKQTAIRSYFDMAMNKATSQSIGIDKAMFFERNGWYLSEIFDSGHIGTTWDRLSLQGDFDDIQVEVWIDDHQEVLESIKKDEESREPSLCSSYPHVFLKPLQGRYLRFLLTIQKDSIACLSGYEILYPYCSHMELLPQMYQESEDLHLFMAPLEDTFLSLQNEIRQLPMMWNPHAATHEQLFMMISFLHLDMLLHEDMDTLHSLLVHYQTWRKRQGTYDALFFLATTILKRNVVLYTEKTCIYMIAVYCCEEEAKHVQDFLSSQISFGVDFHIQWIMNAQMDQSYLDIGAQFDTLEDTVLNHTDMGEQLWL